MRNIAKVLLTAIAAVGVFVIPAKAQAVSGITLSPAMLRIELPPAQSEQPAHFAVTNHYNVPVTMQFTIERSAAANANQSRSVDPANFVSINAPELTLLPCQTLSQTVVLRNTKELAPGSQLADLVITYKDTATKNVAVAQAVRMPLSLIKLDGAVTSLGLRDWGTPVLSMRIPGRTTITLRNNGNMTAIPRGHIVVEDRGGRMVARGTLNTASAAISPGQELPLMTTLTPVGSSWLPGMYHIRLAYGLGGDSGVRTATANFMYAAWWHIALTVAAGTGLFYATRSLREYLHKKSKRRASPRSKRPILIGRDIT